MLDHEPYLEFLITSEDYPAGTIEIEMTTQLQFKVSASA